MTIAPHFDLDQTETHVILHIHVPHVRVSVETVQVVIEEQRTVHFASPPYLLVYTLPQPLKDAAEESCATYEPSIANGRLTLQLEKAVPAWWENLDLCHGLLRQQQERKKNKTARWLHSVETENEATIATTPTTEEVGEEIHEYGKTGYGFLRQYNDIYTDLQRDGLAREMLELPWESVTDNCSIRCERRRKRCEMETDKFSVERYLEDLEIADDYVYQCAMETRPHWNSDDNDAGLDTLASELGLLSLDAASGKHPKSSAFSSDERLQLASIPYPILPTTISRSQERALVAGLLDILYAYVYDHLMTNGDPTVESAWTVSILSASLSCLDDWIDDAATVHDAELASMVILSSFRRTLTYAYIRNVEFCIHVGRQVIHILNAGIRTVVRCLLHTRDILEHSELYYLGNKVWMDAYLAWVQTTGRRDVTSLENKFSEMANCMESFLSKTDPDEILPLLNLGLENVGDEVEDTSTSTSSGEDSCGTNSDSGSSEEGSSSPSAPAKLKTETESTPKPSFLLDIS